MSKSFKFKISLLFLFLFIYELANAHPMGLTFSNLKYTKGILSLSTRIFYADFYYEFQKTASAKNKDYVKRGIDKTDKKDLLKYFKKNIRIWVDNREVHFDTLSYSFERHEEDAYIFIVEMKGKARIKDKSRIKILDSVLLTTIMGQKHLINVFLKEADDPSHGIITLDKSNPVYEFVNE